MSMTLRATVDDRPADGSSIIVFTCGGRRFAIPGAQVAEIAKVAAFVPVPCDDPTNLGVTVHREHVVPLIDLSGRLGAPSRRPAAPPWLCLFVRSALGDMGFPVDEVLAFGSTGSFELPSDVTLIELDNLQAKHGSPARH